MRFAKNGACKTYETPHDGRGPYTVRTLIGRERPGVRLALSSKEMPSEDFEQRKGRPSPGGPFSSATPYCCLLLAHGVPSPPHIWSSVGAELDPVVDGFGL